MKNQKAMRGKLSNRANYLFFTTCVMLVSISGSFTMLKEKNVDDKLNFIVFYVDNLGYGDIEPFGSTIHSTPNLTKLANEGIKFTHFYSASGVCSPSRASLLTGCYPRRVSMHLFGKNGRVLRPVDSLGLNPSEVTIANILNDQGYVSGIIGKWHLGDQPEFLPTRHGFDYFFGIPYSDDMTQDHEKNSIPNAPPLPLMRNEEVIEAPVDRNYLIQRETGEAIKFIERNKESPFFLYLPQSMPGSTNQPFSSPGFWDKSANGAWGDSVEELDWSLGQILVTLKRLELDKNTIIIWTSDNGAPKWDPPLGSNAPLGGWGYTTSEGGQRVPMIAWAPGKIPANITNGELITTMDILPTFTDLAGAQIPDNHDIDGYNISNLFFGEKGIKSPYEVFYYYDGPQLQAIRKREWKLYLPLEVKFLKTIGQEAKLFNVVSDPGEKKNILNKHPDIIDDIIKYKEWAIQRLGDGNGLVDQVGIEQRSIGKVVNPSPRVINCQ